MIISVEKAKELVSFNGWTDEKIKMKLLAVEQTIRAYTNNNFQSRGFRVQADIRAGVFMSESLIPFDIDDTVQVSESRYNNGLFVVSELSDDTTFTVEEDTRDEDNVLVTKVVYPADVVACCVDLLEWDVKHGGKIGIKSETLSRHSVTYEDSSSLFMGYPVGVLNSLKLHMKARF